VPETLDIQVNGSVATVTLNRPDAANAMSHRMVEELIAYFESIRENRAIRCVVIAAAGKTFCAGGDLKDMQADLGMTPDERAVVLARFDAMLQAVSSAPQVIIARVQGAAVGGGVGLVSVSDIAIASDSASFSLTEVKLGLSPALISPYVIARIGISQARRLMLTGARIDADEALACGFVHETCLMEMLDARVQEVVGQVLACSPNALAETKALIAYVSARPPAESLAYRADLINRLRASIDGQEGMLAFIQKRKPAWHETL